MRNDINGPFKFLDVMCDWFLWSNQDLQVYQSSAFQGRIGFYVEILLSRSLIFKSISLSLKTSILWFPGSAAWTLCLSKPSRSTIGWRDSSTVSCAPRTKIITQTKNNQESKYFSNSQNISGNVPYFWTSGRLCDFDGCDRPDFFPKNINGWFWSANQVLWQHLLLLFTYYSGPPTRLVSARPTVPPSTTGPAPEGSAPRDPSLTTGSRFSRWLIQA